jgi:hypothetical protein
VLGLSALSRARVTGFVFLLPLLDGVARFRFGRPAEGTGATDPLEESEGRPDADGCSLFFLSLSLRFLKSWSEVFANALSLYLFRMIHGVHRS